MNAAAKAVKVGDDTYELLNEITRKHGGTIKEHLEKALEKYVAYLNGTLVVKIHSNSTELVDLEKISVEEFTGSFKIPDDIFGPEYKPVFTEFSQKAVRKILELIEPLVDRDEKVTVYRLPILLQNEVMFNRTKEDQWEEDFEIDKMFRNVINGYQISVLLKNGKTFSFCLSRAMFTYSP